MSRLDAGSTQIKCRACGLKVSWRRLGRDARRAAVALASTSLRSRSSTVMASVSTLSFNLSRYSYSIPQYHTEHLRPRTRQRALGIASCRLSGGVLNITSTSQDNVARFEHA